MISIEGVVWATLYLLGGALIFALLFFLVGYIEKQITSGEGSALFFKCVRVFLVVCAVILIIFFILGFMGHPILSLGGRPFPEINHKV